MKKLIDYSRSTLSYINQVERLICEAITCNRKRNNEKLRQSIRLKRGIL